MIEQFDDKEEKEEKEELGLPKNLRYFLLIVFVSFSLFIIIYYFEYFFGANRLLSPENAGFPLLLIYSMTGILLLVIPFEKLGLRLKSIGGVEFEQIITNQANERIEDFTEIDKRIAKIEEKLFNLVSGTGIPKDFDQVSQIREQELQVRDLLMKFLTAYSRWAFSPLRIKNWGAERSGFEAFKDFSKSEIRNELRRLVSDGLVETKISKKGNTLYRIAD